MQVVSLAEIENPGRVDSVVTQVDTATEEERRTKMVNLYKDSLEIPESDKEKFCTFLANHHTAFSLAEGERGETSLIQIHIDTGEAPPQKQAPRRTVRAEVNKQVKQMLDTGVIQRRLEARSDHVRNINLSSLSQQTFLLIEQFFNRETPRPSANYV